MKLELPDINLVHPDDPGHMAFLDYYLKELVAMHNVRCKEYEGIVKSGKKDSENPSLVYFEDDTSTERCIELEGEVDEIADVIHIFGEEAVEYLEIEPIHDTGKAPENYVKVFLSDGNGYFDFGKLDVLKGIMYSSEDPFEGIYCPCDLKSEKGLELLLADSSDEGVFLATLPIVNVPLDSFQLHTAALLRTKLSQQYPELTKRIAQSKMSVQEKVDFAVGEVSKDCVDVEVKDITTYPNIPQNPNEN